MDNLNFDALNDVLGGVDSYAEGEYAEGEYAEGGYAEGEGEYNQTAEGETTQEQEFKVLVKYEYVGERENDLTIYIGDEVTVTQSQGEWWYGYLVKDEHTYSGYFPATYVERLDQNQSNASIDYESEGTTTQSDNDQKRPTKEKTGWRLERDTLKDKIHEQIDTISKLHKQVEHKKKLKQEREERYLATRYLQDTQALIFDLIFLQLERNVEVRSFSMLAEMDQKFSQQIKNLQDLINKEMKDKAVENPKADLFKMFTLISNKISENLQSIGTLTNSSDQFLNVLLKFKNSFVSATQN